LPYLYDAQEGASRRIREMGAEMFGYAVSEATLQRARGALQRLEPDEGKLSSPVLRGGDDRKVVSLPGGLDRKPRIFRRETKP
jgi:hypothetical protein